MVSLSKVKSSFIEQGKRILKVFEYGPKTALPAADYGDDSNPLKEMTALYAKTDVNSEQFIIGYINKNQIAAEGEKRIFSQMPGGSISFAIHLKNDGTCEIGGNADNAVRFTPLKSGVDAKDTLINTELAKISAAIGNLGGTYAPVTINTDISQAKIDELKTL